MKTYQQFNEGKHDSLDPYGEEKWEDEENVVPRSNFNVWYRLIEESIVIYKERIKVKAEQILEYKYHQQIHVKDIHLDDSIFPGGLYMTFDEELTKEQAEFLIDFFLGYGIHLNDDDSDDSTQVLYSGEFQGDGIIIFDLNADFEREGYYYVLE